MLYTIQTVIKRYGWILILIIILILFKVPIANFLNVLFVRPIFQYIESAILTDIACVISSLIFIITSFRIWDKKTSIPIFVAITIIYLFQRINNFWSFEGFEIYHDFKYFDLVYLSVSISFTSNRLLKNSTHEEISTDVLNKGFIEDDAINKPDQDLFGRKIIAKEIADIISLTRNRKSIAIGIVGKYGSGKTSFVNLINHYLESSETEKISFDSWGLGKSESISHSFFDLFASKLSNINPEISTKVFAYSRSLSNIDTWSKVWIERVNFIRKPYTQKTNDYENINSLLHSIEKKIIVTIDDLDRLHNDEIYEVLKLIRNTANFSNVIFLVAYDREYITNALKCINTYGEKDYLDKIFQLEIPLPKIEHDNLIDVFKSLIVKILNEKHYQFFEEKMIPSGFKNLYEESYDTIFRQSRDVIRFINGFKLIYRLIGDEVDLENLIILELLKFRFQKIYNLLYEQKEVFLYAKPKMATYSEFYISKSSTRDKKITAFEELLSNDETLNERDKTLISTLFKKLFQEDEYHIPKNKNSICYPLYFDIYFRYRLSASDLSDKEYRYALSSNNLRPFMIKCANNNLHKGLLTRLLQEEYGVNRLMFEKVISSIFHFGSTYISKTTWTSFPYEELIRKISDYHGYITNDIYKKDKESYREFLRSLFNSALPNYIFHNGLINEIKRRGDFILEEEELTGFQISYFSRFSESQHGLSKESIWLFWGIRKFYKESIDDSGAYLQKWRFEPELRSHIWSAIVYGNPLQFLKSTIQGYMQDKDQVTICSQIIELFGSLSEYKLTLRSSTKLEVEIRDEYFDFLDKCAAVNFEVYISFKFKTDLKNFKNALSEDSETV